MWLQFSGVSLAGNSLLDAGVSDSQIVKTAQGNFVISTSGPYGGLSSHQINGQGNLVSAHSRIFPDWVANAVTHKISVVEFPNETLVFFGATASGLIGAVLQPNGSFGAIKEVSFQELESAQKNGTAQTLSAITELTDKPTGLLPNHSWQKGTVAVQELALGGTNHVLTLGAHDNQLSLYSINSSGNGQLKSSLGAKEGLGIGAATALEVVTIEGKHYALIASSGGSSISVVQVMNNGTLTPVQHIIDTGSTYFANVQDLAIAQQGPHVFVIALGADHGITLFKLLPDGHLTFLEAWHDTDGGALNTPSTVSAEVIGNTLHIVTGAEKAAGLSHFKVGLNNFGTVSTASATSADALSGTSGHDVLIAAHHNDTLSGGGGHDILVSGPGKTTLTGGPGADTFVIRATSEEVIITDFTPGTDRLDLSDLPMLRNLDQLSFSTTPKGAVITYQGVKIVVQSHNGQSLNKGQIFPQGLIGPDSIMLVLGPQAANIAKTDILTVPAVPTPPNPPSPNQVQGKTILGTSGNDTLEGGDGDNYLNGGAGNDVIRGGAGNDTIFGGPGNDLIVARDGDDLVVAGPGNDVVWAGAGNDTVFAVSGNNRIGGGPGDDLLVGGTGNDTIYAGLGNDTVFGNSGSNVMYGGPGDDIVYGGSGNDTIGGGPGNDTIVANAGNNMIFGGEGHDFLQGGTGNDTIFGGPGNDTIIGIAGNNELWGGPGNDYIHAGPGDDTVTGGPGADVFVFKKGDQNLTITDFSPDQNDTLLLQSALFGGSMSANDVIASYAQVSNGSVVFNFGGGDMITLQGISTTNGLANHIDIG